MSEHKGKNIFEKIGSFIPGYKGYSEKEGRKDTDKLLRLEIASQLDSMKKSINNLIRQHSEAKQLELVSTLDRIRLNLDLAANQVRYASHGISGFFDVVQVDITDLDRLYQFDLHIKEEIEQLASMINTLPTSVNLKESCLSITEILSKLTDKIAKRDKALMEVR